MKSRFKLINWFKTNLVTNIPAGAADDTTEYSFVISQPIEKAPVFVLIDGEDNIKRDIIYIHRIDGTTCYYYNYNRTNPTVEHITGADAEIANVAEYFNYIFENIDDFGHIQRKTGLNIIVKGGTISINGNLIDIDDTNITLNDNATNYIILDYSDHTIKNVSNLTGYIGYLIATITTNAGNIVDIKDERSIVLPNIFDSTYFINDNGIITLNTAALPSGGGGGGGGDTYKVKINNTDTTPGFLIDKLDAGDFSISGGKIIIKPGKYALSTHTHTHNDITDFNSAVSNHPDVSANTSARHTHSNKNVLDNITDSGDGTKFLADDGTYKTISGGGASTFKDLTDTPADYTGQGGKFVRVKSDESGLEFVAGTSSTDTKTVKVSNTDTTDGFLVDKISAGDNITITTQNSGGNEQLQISATVPDVSGKADKVSGATDGNLAGLDASGNLTDSGYKPSDFATATHTHSINDLSDVDTTGVVDGQVLKYDGTNNKWIPSDDNVGGTGDVSDALAFQWFMDERGGGGGGGLGVADGNDKVKADSNDATPGYLADKVDNTTLEVDTTNHKLKVKDNVFASSSHTHNLNDLGNVNITTPTSGEVLGFDGSVWKNVSLSSGGLIKGICIRYLNNESLSLNDNNFKEKQESYTPIVEKVDPNNYFTEDTTNKTLTINKTGTYLIISVASGKVRNTNNSSDQFVHLDYFGIRIKKGSTNLLSQYVIGQGTYNYKITPANLYFSSSGFRILNLTAGDVLTFYIFGRTTYATSYNIDCQLIGYNTNDMKSQFVFIPLT